MGKLIKIYAIVCASLFALWLTFTILSENEHTEPKDQWYEYNECYGDRFIYRIFNEKGKWVLELKNNTNEDMILDFEVSNYTADYENHSVVVKGGQTTGQIGTELQHDENGPELTVTNVALIKSGKAEDLGCE